MPLFIFLSPDSGLYEGKHMGVRGLRLRAIPKLVYIFDNVFVTN